MATYNTLRTLVKDTLAGKTMDRPAGSRAWRIVANGEECMLYHYATRMLTWRPDGTIVQRSLGIGSVSDQAGVNAALSTLDANFRYARGGGAHWYYCR